MLKWNAVSTILVNQAVIGKTPVHGVTTVNEADLFVTVPSKTCDNTEAGRARRSVKAGGDSKDHASEECHRRTTSSC
jgi:hypothetical protein